MLGFLKSFFGNDNRDSQLEAELAIAADGLDIQMAMAAHDNWKLRLQAYLNGASKEDFLPEVICFDDRCDLGRWIHGDGAARLGRYPGFTALLGHHKMFHYAASNVVALSKGGKEAEAQKMLEGSFNSFSAAVNQDLMALKQVVERVKVKQK